MSPSAADLDLGFFLGFFTFPARFDHCDHFGVGEAIAAEQKYLGTECGSVC